MMKTSAKTRVVKPKKAFIWLVRHGNAEGNGQHIVNGSRVDAPLTREGKRQAKALAKAFPFKPDVLLSSPLTRAVSTARELARKWHMQLHLTKLAEEQDYGPHWSGRPIFELVAHKEWRKRFWLGKTNKASAYNLPEGGQIHTLSPLGGESWAQMKKRAAKLMAWLDKTYAGKRVMLVSHSDFINCCIGVRRELPDAKVLARPDIPNCNYVRL